MRPGLARNRFLHHTAAHIGTAAPGGGALTGGGVNL